VALAQILADFVASVSQCEALIAHAHQVDGAGSSVLPPLDREQITVAALLNMHVAWEVFLESSMTELMIGSATINGNQPVRFVSPPTQQAANQLIVGVMRFFDFANTENVRKMVPMYFQNGYPFEPHISAVFSDLSDLRTMRNASAHTSTTTQSTLEALARRIFGAPRPGITLYSMLTSTDPRSTSRDTVFKTYRDKLVVAASLIATG
jgi:hypothetical protein